MGDHARKRGGGERESARERDFDLLPTPGRHTDRGDDDLLNIGCLLHALQEGYSEINLGLFLRHAQEVFWHVILHLERGRLGRVDSQSLRGRGEGGRHSKSEK